MHLLWHYNNGQDNFNSFEVEFNSNMLKSFLMTTHAIH